MLALLLDPIFHVFQEGLSGLPTSRVDLVTRGIVLAVEPRLVGKHASANRGDRRRRRSDRSWPAARPTWRSGEPFRIDDPDLLRQRRAEPPPGRALRNRHRLHHRPADPVRPAPTPPARPGQLRQCSAPTCAVPPNGPQAGVTLWPLARTSRPTSRVLLQRHPPLRFLARAGSRPMQLFGFRKTPDLSLAPLHRIPPPEVHGAQIRRRTGSLQQRRIPPWGHGTDPATGSCSSSARS